jgi:hypothetical protein
MPSVIIVQHSPFADEQTDDQEQPKHFARDEDDDGDLIDAHLALAETEVRYWRARKAWRCQGRKAGFRRSGETCKAGSRAD